MALRSAAAAEVRLIVWCRDAVIRPRKDEAGINYLKREISRFRCPSRPLLSI
jgi:hypothetical protein